MFFNSFLLSIIYFLLCMMALFIGIPLLFSRKTRETAITLTITSLVAFPILIFVYLFFSILLFPPTKKILDLLYSRELDQLIWWIIALYHLAMTGTALLLWYGSYRLSRRVAKRWTEFDESASTS